MWVLLEVLQNPLVVLNVLFLLHVLKLATCKLQPNYNLEMKSMARKVYIFICFALLMSSAVVGLEVAKGKATRQSSTAFRGTSDRAVDGNTNGDYDANFCTHTSSQTNPWWRVDLGSSKVVTKVVIYNRDDCCKNRLSNMEIRIGDNSANNGNSNPVCRSRLSLASKTSGVFSCPAPLKGRYVNIRLVGSRKILTLCEVQVYTGECNKVWTSFGGSQYKICDTPTQNWIDAQKACQNMGANLPKVETDAENTFLYKLQKNAKIRNSWMGMIRDENNQFYWFDGTSLEYTNWAQGQPDHWKGREHCAELLISRNRKWNDVPCFLGRNTPRFICEVPKCNNTALISSHTISPQPIMKSSSVMDSNHTATAGNFLNTTSIWCPQSNSTIEWLEVDLGAPYLVCGVAAVNNYTTGGSSAVTWYKVSTSLTEFVEDTNNDTISQELQTNSTVNAVLVKEFYRVARYIRFNPTRWTGWPCLKVEVYGKKVPPLQMTVSVRNRTVEHGLTTVFRCLAYGFPFPSYSWTRNGSSVIDNGVLSEQNTVLRISPTDLDSEGWYTCTATNQFGKVSSSGYLTIHAKPQDLKAPSFVNGFRGTDAVLTCESFAHPVPNVTWINNNIDISSARFRVDTVLIVGNPKTKLKSTLTISSVTVTDSGWYTCKFWNYLGSIEDSIELQIVDACSPVVFNFEKGPKSLDSWGRTGTAFNSQPTYDDNVKKRLAGQTANQEGSYWIGTYENRPTPKTHPGLIQGELLQGSLTSPEFQIIGPNVSFLVGGGCVRQRAAVQLLVDGRVVRFATGRCREAMVRKTWDVKGFIGKRARLRLIDFYSRNWGHINFDDFRGNVTRCSGCLEPLGLELGKVPNFAMTASSMWSKNHAPYFGRLNMLRRDGHVGSWSSRLNAIGQWLQVDFGTTVNVTKVATQGRADSNQWVTGYSIAYSYNLSAWQFYQDGEALRGNRDRNTMVEYFLSPTIRARYIRIYPRTWNGHISMRLELFGCPPIPAAPKILGLPKEVRAKTGAIVTLFCKANGFPYRTYTWTKLDESGAVITLTQTQQLVIRNISVASDAFYKCTASNAVGKDEFVVHLIVHTMPSITQGLQTKQYLTKGMKANLTCKGLGVPFPTVTWFKDGLQVTNNSRKYISTSETLRVVSTLSFYEVQYKDGGLYTCAFNNTEGSVNSTGTVILYVAPEFVIEPKDTFVVQGNDVRLPCLVSGAPQPTIRWKFEGKYIEKPIIINNGTLVIENVLNNDLFEGTYTCEATNPWKKAFKTAKLDVYVPPSFKAGITSQKLLFAETQIAIMHCDVIGDPTPVVEWTRDGIPLDQNGGVTFLSGNQILAIHKLVSSYTGRYVCSAKNPAGNVTSTFDLTVYGKPTIDTILTRKEIGSRIGQKTNLLCFASNAFPVNYTWTKEGVPVLGGEHIVVRNHILILTPRRESDFGIYVCHMTNPAGNASYNIELINHGESGGPVVGAQSSPDQNNKKSVAIAVPLLLVIVALVVLLLFLAYRYRRYRHFTHVNNLAYNMVALEPSGTSAPNPTAVENPMYGSG